MPSTEPTFGWPIPDDTDPLADGAAAMRALAGGVADSLANDLAGLMVQAGTITAGPSNASSFSQSVTFPRQFATGLTVVMVNLASGAGGTAQWTARALSAGRTGFTLFGYGPNITTFDAPWTWLAVGQRQT